MICSSVCPGSAVVFQLKRALSPRYALPHHIEGNAFEIALYFCSAAIAAPYLFASRILTLEPAPTAQDFLGEVGERVNKLSITQVTIRPLSPSTVLVEGRDPSGHHVKWVTRSHIADATESITFSVATVKAHESYTGTHKTLIAAAKITACTVRETEPEELFQIWDGQVFTYEELRREMESDAAGVESEWSVDLRFDFDEWLAEELLGGSVKRVTDRNSPKTPLL